MILGYTPPDTWWPLILALGALLIFLFVFCYFIGKINDEN